MKTLRTIGLTTVAILGMAVVAMAGGSDSLAEKGVLVVPVKKDSKYKVIYSSDHVENVKVKIMDQYGAMVYTERIKDSSFKRPYVFKNLPFGDYTIEVIDSEGKYVYPVKHEAYSPKTPLSGMEITMSELEGKKFRLKVVGEDLQPLRVKIYQGGKDLIYDDYIEMTSNFDRVYDLVGVYGKDITFEFFSQDVLLKKESFK